MIFLYSKLDIQNKGEGLGSLQDFVEEPIVTWNASGFLEVEFKYFLYGDLAEYMIPDAKLRTRIHSNDEVYHLFTIYEVEPDYIENTIQVRAEMTLLHELKDRVVPAGTMRGTANEMIMFVKNRMDRDYPFVITGTTDGSVFIEYDNISAYELIFGEDGILKRTGAEIEFTDRGIRVSNRIGTIHRDELRESDFVTNLTVNELQGEDFVTRIIPFTTAMFDRPVRDGDRYTRETIETPTYGTPVISPNITNKLYKVRTKFVEYRNESTEVPKYYNYRTERGTETLEMSQYIYEDVTALNQDASTFFEDNLGIDEPTTTISIETLGLAKGYYTYLRYLNRYDIVTIYVEPKPYLTNNSETYVVQVNETVYEPLSDNLVSIGFTNDSLTLRDAYRNVNEGRISDQQLQAELQKERLRDLEDKLVNYVYNHDGFRLEFGNVLPPPDEYREGDMYYLETGEGIDLYKLVNGVWEFLVGQSTREIIEGKIAEIEEQAEELTKDIEASDQKADEAKETAGLAKNAVDALETLTQETADKMVDVEQIVADAKTNASQAKTDAIDALAKARESATNSSGALALAGQAATDVQTAINTAEAAQTDALTAIDNANTALSTAGNADSKAGQAIAKANAIPTTVSDIITDKNLVNGSYVDTKIDGATGAWSQELTRVEGKIPTEIGGRNLVLNTQGEHNPKIEGGIVYTLPLSKTGDYLGKELTFRFRAKSSNGTNRMYISLGTGSGSLVRITGYIPIPEEYTEFKYTFTASADPNITTLMIVAGTQWHPDNEGSIMVTDIKLETGNIATDWTPAPEDLYSQEEFKIFNAQYTQDVTGMTGRLTTVENGKLDGSTFQTFKQSEYQVTADTVASTVERVDTAEGQISTQGTAISQNATAIASKADKTVVDTLSGTVTTQGTAISQNATAISQRVTTTTYNTGLATKENSVLKQSTAPAHLSGRLWLDTSVTPNILKRSTGTAWVKATPTTASEVGAYSSGQGSALAGRVTTAETNITQTSEALTSKADKSVVDTLSGTVSTHTTTLSQHATAISSKAAQTEVDTVKGTVSSHTSTLSQHAKDISARLTQTQVNSLVTEKGYSTVSYVDTQMSATAVGIRTEMTAVEGKIPTYVGGRNFVLNTQGEHVSEIAVVTLYRPRLSKTGDFLGTELTLSFKAKSSNGTNRMYISLGTGGSTMVRIAQDITIPKEYTDFKYTFTSIPDARIDELLIVTGTTWYPNNSGSITVTDIKLEKGKVATDWTPAPEDMMNQSEFNTFKAEYDQSASGWSSKLLQIEQADYATRTWSNQTFATPQSVTTQLSSYAKTSALNGMVTETSLANKSYITSSAVNTLLTSYAKTTALNGMVTETTLASKKFATASSVSTQLQSYAKTTDLNGLATQTYVGSQISATAGTIRSEITAVENKIPTEIGGRNLIKNSQESFKVSYPGTGELNKQYNVGQGITIPLTIDNEYTISFRARGNIRIGLYRISSSGNSAIEFVAKSELSATEYRKFSLTFRPHRDELTGVFLTTGYNTGIAGWYEVAKDSLKLESGTVATDWSPAPEDMATNQQVSSIEQKANSIQALVGTTNDSVARAVMTSNLWETEVVSEITGLSSTVSQLSDSWALTLKSGDDIKTQLNASTNGIRIKGSLIYLDGNTTMNNAFARSLIVDKLYVADVTAFTSKFSKVIANSIDVNEISGNAMNFISGAFVSNAGSLLLSGSGIRVNFDDGYSLRINGSGTNYYTSGGLVIGGLRTAVPSSGTSHTLSLNARKGYTVSMDYQGSLAYDRSNRALSVDGTSGNITIHRPIYESSSSVGLSFLRNQMGNVGWGLLLTSTRATGSGIFLADNGQVWIGVSGGYKQFT